MRKFIISDIHGNGNLYYSIMSYLENISKEEDITLYINGDLIDRGLESGEILLDVIKRIKRNDKNFKIEYLGGNHELMMYQTYKNREKGILDCYSDWYYNGGAYTDFGLDDALKSNEEILKVVDFISNLKIYKKFKEKIKDKRILLIHASCPMEVSDECNLKIKDDNNTIEHMVWEREIDHYRPFRAKIGNKKDFLIIGHTPVLEKYGYSYSPKENYLNIDGGSACYVSGIFNYDHYPLVEVKEDYLKILTFNNNNEIIYGNYFKDNISIPYNEKELEDARKYLNKELKSKKLVKLEDGIIGYSDWK